MKVVIGIDALEHAYVEAYDNRNLKQVSYGKTDISEFSEPRTMVLWSSFMTGVNKEQEVLAEGDKEMWNIRWPVEDTLFSSFENPVVIDLPGYNYDKQVHDRSRELLKKYFESEDPAEKEEVKKQYNQDAFDHHRKVKTEFMEALGGDHDFVLGYFSVADVVGHLNFGNNVMMNLIYKDLDDMAGKVDADKKLVLSDHGMKAIGEFGDHSEYGFWSLNYDAGLKNPRITEFRELIEGW